MAPSSRRRFISLPWRSARRLEADLDDEVRLHVDLRADELRAQGMSDADARRIAIGEFGDLPAVRRSCLEEDLAGVRADRWSDSLVEARQDAKQAFRMMRRSPGFAVVTLITLALCIGANTAIFSVVRGVLLERLPYHESDRLIRAYSATHDGAHVKGQIAAGDYIDFRDRQRTLTGLAAYSSGSLIYLGNDTPEQWSVPRVTADFFTVLATPPLLGRTFRAGEDAPGSDPIVVISHRLWQSTFGGDPGIVGRRVRFESGERTVIGVMGPRFVSPIGRGQAWAPLDLTPILRDVNRSRKFRWLTAVGRLRDGETLDRARADLASIASALERTFPESNTGFTTALFPLRDVIVGEVRPALRVLMGAAGLVLLIGCANVAGVLLSRTLARRRELALRATLGAGRGRLIRQLLTESVLLAVAGGAIGLALGWWGTSLLTRLGARVLPMVGPIRVDLIVLAFTTAIAVGCGLLMGVVPALAATRRDAQDALKDTGPGSTGGRGRQRLRAVLVTGQLALSVVLLIGAGLLVRSLAALQQVELGYNTSQLLVFNLTLGRRYSTAASQDQFFDALYSRLRTLPGVLSVASTGVLPLNGGASAGLAIEGRPVPEGKLPEVGYVNVSDDYFRTMRIPLIEGRAFDATDRGDTRPVVIVSQRLARNHWPGKSPIGARVRLGPNPNDPWSEVVGVVGDVRNDATIIEPDPVAYVSSKQDHWGGGDVAIRTAGDPTSLIGAVRRELAQLDPALPMTNVKTMEELFDDTLASRRLPMQLLGGFALLALLLAAVGVYGVMSHAVVSRTREFGIRMALGARAQEMLTLVLRQGLLTAAAGLLVGFAGALALTRVLGRLLFGVRPLDPLTFIAVGVTLTAVTLIACWIPARRATRVDPLGAIRAE